MAATSPPDTIRLPSVAFFEPRIPENSGNAIRLSAVTGAHLHLIDPLFDLSEPKLRRAGLDYHDLATVHVHQTLEEMLAAADAAADAAEADAAEADAASDSARVFAFTTAATERYTDVEYRPGDVLLFGPEPTGLPDEVLRHPRITAQVRIPMLPGRRSLNLSNAAAIAVYEAARQAGFAGQR